MQTTEREVNSKGRDDPRAQIMRAARALAAREGIESVTLANVATEASLPRPVVFGQFVRKEDLVLCVAADSVATLATAIGGVYLNSQLPVFDESSAGAVILSLPRSEPTQQTPEMMVGLAREISSALATSKEPSAGAAATASSLDRRLGEFERTIQAMHTRQAEIEQKTREVVNNVQDSVNQAVSKLSELVARVDQAETRQKAAASDLRANLNDANLRIQTVEGVARAALVENGSAPAVVPPAPPPLVAEVSASDHAELAAPQSEKQAPAVTDLFAAYAPPTTLMAGPAKFKIDAPDKPSTIDYSSRYAAAGLVVVAIFVAAAGVAFSQGVHDGRREALQRIGLATPSRAIAPSIVATSLDQLTARAERGDAAAELAVATKYLNDPKPASDPVAAFRWMSRAALHGNAVAQYMLGTLYQQGTGTPADAAQAMRWYQAAATQGNRKAMHNLGIAYAEGLSGVKNPSEAVRWLSRAANFGYVDSQFDLAVLYERGDGVPLSLLDAYKWYAIAGIQGDTKSKSRIQALRTQLSSDDLAAAQHAADTFKPEPYDPAANLPPKI